MSLFETGDDLNAGDQFLVVPFNSIDWARDQLYAALALLTSPENWDQLGTATPDQAAQVFSAAIEDAFLFPDPVGMIVPYGAGALTLQPHALPCDGSLYATTDFPSLFGVIGYTFGGSGAQFAVPDLRAIYPLGAGGSVHGVSVGVGGTGGEQSHTLVESEIPVLNHAITPHSHSYIAPVVTPTLIQSGAGAAPTPIPSATGLASDAIAAHGAGGAHENMPPYLALAYWIITGL